MTVQPDEAVVGSFSRFVVRVPNERDDATTTAVQVELPPLAFVSFQDSPGWERTVEMTTSTSPSGCWGSRSPGSWGP
jgi:periplasmic copper chaperone A